MKTILTAVLLLMSVVAFSQEKNNGFKPDFRLVVSGGITIGEKNVSPVFQVVPAAYYKKFSVGIGSGIDFYRFRSIPLVADLRYNFGRGNFGFVYANTGYNFPFDIETTKTAIKTTDTYKGGFYGDFGAGYRVFRKSKHALLFSVGYSIKNIENTVGLTYQPFEPSAKEDLYHYRYSMSRIVSKLSWEFGKR